MCNPAGAVAERDMLEVQDIFLIYGDEYRKNHKLPANVLQAMSAIEKCRTQALGGHADVCGDCGHVRVSYNSCRNRHCPKCQTLARERWVDGQKNNLLNVRYFHVVLTIPDTLNTIAFQNQDVVYNILFKAASETLSELCHDRKYLGADIGFTAVLHTWGQNLMHHPHLHCIVPGGGIDETGKWINSRKKFFIPVKVLSRKFRGKFLYFLKKAFLNEKLNFFGEQSYLQDKNRFNDFLSKHYEKEWVVYCKPPFKDASCVVEYLGRYTHRVAISNSRILSIDNGRVRFKWRDYKDNSKWKVMDLSADEFIRRFLIHILPAGFMKIRHYGLLGNRNRKTKILICKQLTNTAILLHDRLSTDALIMKVIGIDINRCPYCGSINIFRRNLSKAPPCTLKIS